MSVKLKNPLVRGVYWNKGMVFLLPLTGLNKKEGFKKEAFLRWSCYTIEDYQLVVKVNYENKEEFERWLEKDLLMRSSPFICEAHDFEGYSLLIFDLSHWHEDVEMFLLGRYSKLSKEAKEMIQNYHRNPDGTIHTDFFSYLYPDVPQAYLGGRTALEYIKEEEQWDFSSIGEIAGIPELANETFKSCQDVTD